MAAETTEEKLDKLEEFLHKQDMDDHIIDWEIEFISNCYMRHKQYDVEFSSKEEAIIDRIYEKLWKKGLM